ncbi:MAG: trypsin-like peptidase domain-containing protein [Gammaproteobacteria bacterium]|nr:trypsin-like peptidase domain-containing protein [Gammaproteobacteria bacterium]
MCLPTQVLALNSKTIYQLNENRVFQIRVLNRETGKKSSIGSGFIYGSSRQIITNYHVIGQFIQEPERFYISFLGKDGNEGELSVKALDIAHDLALLVSQQSLGEPIKSSDLPPRGAAIFAMGNPLDLGLTIAVGTNGGILNQTDDSRILFSGSLNPGMSGGPTFDEAGNVIGINVATARNDISFIVPSRYLNALINSEEQSILETESQFKTEISNQIIAYENKYIQRILDRDWPSLELRKLKLPGVISPTIRCWDNSKKLNINKLYKRFQIRCANQNNIYLDDTSQFVGDLSYEYYWLESDQLDPVRFYNLYEKLNKDQIGSRVSKEVVSNFNCGTWFIEVASQEFKSNLCRREYVEYQGLSDVLFTAAMTGYKQQGFFITLTMTGVDFQSTLPLLKKFLESIEWNH